MLGEGHLPGWIHSPRGHPPFPLPREGEGTEGVRAIPPPGVGGTIHARRRRRHHLTELLPVRPPDVTGAGPSKNHPRHLQRTDPRSGMNGRRLGVPVAGEQRTINALCDGHSLGNSTNVVCNSIYVACVLESPRIRLRSICTFR
jgi:hypothetical protein